MSESLQTHFRKGEICFQKIAGSSESEANKPWYLAVLKNLKILGDDRAIEIVYI